MYRPFVDLDCLPVYLFHALSPELYMLGEKQGVALRFLAYIVHRSAQQDSRFWLLYPFHWLSPFLLLAPLTLNFIKSKIVPHFRFLQYSLLRPVPSHQEIYLSATGFTSLILEINERVEDLGSDQEALRYHFDDVVTPGDINRVWETSDVMQLPNFP